MADQQFCLRWNNHQSTLISVFDSLQERGCMVDCTLAAEGQSLQAHKVVLSACSPYLEDLLSKHYDKHPILLLKDVKFEELRAMLDYMYRGEVNVAQDKLNCFLKAAESLQIKGLSDGGTDPPDSGGTVKRTSKGAPIPVRSSQVSVRPTNDHSTRDGSVSPSRKRRRRRGSEGSDHDSASNVPDGRQSLSAAAPTSGSVVNDEVLPTVPTSGSADTNLLLSSIMENPETENATDSGISSATNVVPLSSQVNNVIGDRDADVLVEPKTEYLDDDAQDLPLDDDDGMFRAGPSHARGSGNFVGDGDDFMTGQESGANAQGGERRGQRGDADLLLPDELAGAYAAHHLMAAVLLGEDIEGSTEEGGYQYQCADCGQRFRAERTLSRHRRVHNQFRPHQCATCGARFTNKSHLTQHIRTHTGEKPYACARARCGARFVSRSHLVVHERRHTGERPFACPVSACGARFTESSHLLAHVRRHGGERIYKCAAAGCDARFIHNSDLMRHAAHSHSAGGAERPFLCSRPGCGRAFARSSGLSKHERRHGRQTDGEDGADGSEGEATDASDDPDSSE